MKALLLVMMLALPASAQQVAQPASFDCGALYEAGSYAEAAACFGSLEATGNHNGHVLYNQGNAWYRAGDVGRAVHAYRRALLYLPRDGDVRANLASARSRAKDALEPPDSRGALGRALLAPYDSFSAGELLLLGSLAWALLFSALAVRTRRELIGGAGLLVLIAIFAGLNLIGWTARSYQLRQHPVAVVLSAEVTLRSGRDLQSVDLARLHAGAEGRVVERTDDWVQVALSSGQRGWLPASEVGLVLP